MDTYEEALDVSREVGDLYGEAMMLVNVGARLVSLGAQREGAHILEHAIRLTEELGPIGMKLRQRAEGLLMSVRTQHRQEGGRSGPSRERSGQEPRGTRSRDRAGDARSVPPASMIPPVSGEQFARSVSLPR
jgi:hypothetical protein